MDNEYRVIWFNSLPESFFLSRLWITLSKRWKENFCMIKLYFPLSILSKGENISMARRKRSEKEIYGLLKFCVKFNDPFPIYIRTRTRAIVIADIRMGMLGPNLHLWSLFVCTVSVLLLSCGNNSGGTLRSSENRWISPGEWSVS